jgi:radical SAM protein with 4Fe4S-binding SPASM domain
MGILHRLYAKNAPRVWEIETRLMRQLGYVRPPSAVQWITSSVCDLKCPHCYSHAGKKGKGELSTSEAKELIIDELVKLGRPTFVIAGGEPLLRPDFEEIVAYSYEKGVPWALHTHGGRVAKLRHVFEKYPPLMVAVSLDGTREFHDAFRGRAGSFDAALEAIRTLKEVGCKEVVAGTVVTRANADLLADMFPVVMESGADSWGLHLIAPEGRGHENAQLLPTPEQLRRVAGFARRMRSHMRVEMDNEWGSAGRDDPFYRDMPFLCGAGRFTFVVAANGDVMPCTTTDPAESEGNIRERSLTDIWASGFRRFRSAGNGDCSNGMDCWLQTRNGHFPRAHAFSERTNELPMVNR